MKAHSKNEKRGEGLQKRIDPSGSGTIPVLNGASLAQALKSDTRAADAVGAAPEGGKPPAITGRVVGYDKDFNPITEEQLKASVKPNEFTDQKVDGAEASSELNAIIEAMTGKTRLNQEFLTYLSRKYENVARPPDGMDVYENPQNYTAEQKLARFVDLLKLKSQFESYRDARLKPNTGHMRTIKTEPEIKKDIDQAIATLLEDPATAGLLSSEYLFVIKEMLGGKHLQDDPGQYGQDYTDQVNQLRSELEKRFEDNLVNGGLFKGGEERGANEKTILSNYNTALKAYSSIFSVDFIESRQDAIGKNYSDFYNSKVEPLLPDASNSPDRLLYAGLNADIPEEQKDKIGIVTPTVDGKSFVDPGLSLKTTDLVSKLSDIKVDEATQKEMRELGLDPSLMKDGFAASFLPAVETIADQLFGNAPASKAERAEFIATVLKELRPLAEKLDQGMGVMDLNGALERVQMKMRQGGGAMAKYAGQISTALNGLIRGANLTGNHLLAGMYRAGMGFDLSQVQTLTALAVGYEGKGLAQTRQPEGALRPDDRRDNSGVARQLFGTEGRAWDSSLLKRFGTEGITSASRKFTGDLQALLPSSIVRPPIIDLTSEGRAAIDDALKTYAEAVAKGIYGEDTAAAKQFASNLIRFTYNLWSGTKPGGGVHKIYHHAQEIINRSYTISDGQVSVAEQQKALTKWSAAFLGGIRAIEAGVTNAGTLNPASISSIALYSATGAAQLLGAISASIKPSTMDASILWTLEDYAGSAREALRNGSATASSALSGLVDIAWLPVDIYSFVRKLKDGSLDTVEKIFHGVMIATDVGVAVDGALSLARAVLPASIITGSRLSTFFIGTGGAIMSAIGAIFTIANIGVMLFLNFWQDQKMKKQFDRAGDTLDHNLSRLVNDNASDHLEFYPKEATPWGGDAEKQELWNIHLNNMYRQDVTPYDWDWVRANNRYRNETAAAA